MSKQNIALGIGALALILSIVGLVGGNQSAPVGGSTSATWTAANLVSNGDLTVADDFTLTDDLIVNGGSAVLTTTNAATSSLTVGCVQSYATSTATAIRFGIGTIATSSPISSGGTGLGFVLWQYGSCPI